MSDENQNNNWKSRLDELESLQGEIMPDKNATWEKLHLRLGGKKSNHKKMIWYWAAACLLLVLMMPVLVVNKEESQLTKTGIKQKQQLETSTDAVIQSAQDPVKLINSPLKKNEVIAFPKRANKLHGNVTPAEVSNRIPSVDTLAFTGVVKENINNLLQPLDTSSHIVATLPAKKKLKVIHINELGDAVEVLPDMVTKRDLRSFQLKLATQEVYIKPSVALNKAGITIFKTRSSSN